MGYKSTKTNDWTVSARGGIGRRTKIATVAPKACAETDLLKLSSITGLDHLTDQDSCVHAYPRTGGRSYWGAKQNLLNGFLPTAASELLVRDSRVPFADYPNHNLLIRSVCSARSSCSCASFAERRVAEAAAAAD